MDSSRWSRIEALFDEALAIPTRGRGAFLRERCGDDEALLREVMEMLEAADTHALSIERFVVDDEQPHDPLINAVLGSWRVVEQIGRGGGGVVYRAERADGQYEQQAALKLVAPGARTPLTIERFRDERRLLARLTHPHIARLIDGGFTPEGTPYIVMEYVDGVPITTYCDRHALPLDDRLRLFAVVCEAVGHAHRALIVHRDLKPSNIHVASSGDVKLLDFGIAKLIDADSTDALAPATRLEHRALTPEYAAPEQLRGEPVTTSADVYSLGVVLYELLTGQRPFRLAGLSLQDFERAVLSDEPARPSAVVASARDARRLRGDLDRICLMALRKEPERRYTSVEQLADDIKAFLDGRPVIAQPSTVTYRTRRFIGRNRMAVAAASSFLLLVVAFAAGSAVQSRMVAAERDRARLERDKAQGVVQLLVDLFQVTNPEVVPGGDRLTAAEFLSRAEPRVLDSAAARPEIVAAMKHVLGQVHGARSDYPRARQLLESALVESRRLHGQEDIGTLTIQIDLGWLLMQQGERAPARALLQETLAQLQRTSDAGGAVLARALTVLAQTYGDDWRQAKPLLERALAIRRAVLAADDLAIAETLDALAVAEMNAERTAEARALFEEALRIVDANNGGRNLRAVAVMSNFATLLGRGGDFAAAEALYRRARALAVELNGADSIQVATATNNVATALAAQGKLAQAVEMFGETFEQHVRLLGTSHWRTANAARNAAMGLLFLERADEAQVWMDRAVSAHDASTGADAMGTAYVRAQQARVLDALGKRREAIALLRSSIATIAELAPPEGIYGLADARQWLGRALLADGAPQQAEPLFQEALAFRRRVQPDGHPQRAIAECDLARALNALGRRAEARTLLDRCVPTVAQYALIEAPLRRNVIRLREQLRAAAVDR